MTPRTSEPCLAAQAASSAREILRRTAGDAAFERALLTLSEHDRTEIVAMGSLGWVPLERMRLLYEAVAAELGRDVDLLTDETIFRASADNFRTVWKPFLRLVSDEAVLKRIPNIYSHVRNRGTLHGEPISPGRARLVLSGWPEATERDVRTLAVAIRAALDSLGRREPRCTYVRRGDLTHFETEWRV